jgi:hypothetical protein
VTQARIRSPPANRIEGTCPSENVEVVIKPSLEGDLLVATVQVAWLEEFKDRGAGLKP